MSEMKNFPQCEPPNPYLHSVDTLISSRSKRFVVVFALCLCAVSLARGENALLEARVVDAQSGRTKATFIARTAIAAQPERKTFTDHRDVRLAKRVGRVAVAAEMQFLQFSKDAVWFAINTDTETTNKRRAGMRRVIHARAFVRYGESHKIDNIFAANGQQLSLIITPRKEPDAKPGFSFWRMFARR